MYFEKRFLLYAFNKLSTLTGDPTKQGATQNVSAIRHLLATDAVLKETGLESVDCGQKNDQRKFIAQVNVVVSVFDGNYTTNFYSIKPHGGDCCVGSNFFSAGAVKKSDINPSLTFSYPDRGEGKELLSIKNSHIKPHANSYENLANYFPSPEYKAAFVIWLSRCFGEFNNIDNLHSDVRAYLSTIYSNKLVMALLPAEDEFNEFVNNFNDDKILADSLVEFVSADFQSSSAAETPVVEAMGRVRLNMELENYLAAIRTKPFILLAGISGTGKSRIVRQLAKGCCKADSVLANGNEPGNFASIAVRPNWHDSTELIGYVSRLGAKPRYIITDFVRFLAKAWQYEDVPFFLCLDEMNLAPVEQYFAEYLSVVESRSRADGKIESDVLIKWADDDIRKCALEELFGEDASPNVTLLKAKIDSDKGLRLPPNLIVMGTVNMDETTFSFSRKVLDRAMSFELNEVDMDAGLQQRNDIEYGAILADSAKASLIQGCEAYAADQTLCDKVKSYLIAINERFEGTSFKIAYRTRDEMMIYCIERTKSGVVGLMQALDEATSMKILSRIEGDTDRITEVKLTSFRDLIVGELLKVDGKDGTAAEVAAFLGDAEKVKASACCSKLNQMIKTVHEGAGFVSFWQC